MQDILKYNMVPLLPIKDIMSYTLVNKFCNFCYPSENIWKDFIMRDFSNTKIFKINYHETFKLCFKLNKLVQIMQYNGNIDGLYNCEHYNMSCGAGFNGMLSPIISELCNLKSFETKYQMDNFPIPTEIGKLKSLTSISLDCCNVINLPTELGELNNLTMCRFSGCKISTVPTELGKLCNLTKLCLSNNFLTILPTELGNLHDLSILYLYHNELVTLPSELNNLQNLRELWLSHNKLHTLPLDFSKLPNLSELSLKGNNLDMMTIQLLNLPNYIRVNI